MLLNMTEHLISKVFFSLEFILSVVAKLSLFITPSLACVFPGIYLFSALMRWYDSPKEVLRLAYMFLPKENVILLVNWQNVTKMEMVLIRMAACLTYVFSNVKWKNIKRCGVQPPHNTAYMFMRFCYLLHCFKRL